MFSWGEVDPIDDWRCGVKENDIEMPPETEAKNTDENCCIDFDVDGKKHIFCSTEQPLCTLRILQFARYLKISCLLHWHGMKFDPSSAPSKAELDKTTKD